MYDRLGSDVTVTVTADCLPDGDTGVWSTAATVPPASGQSPTAQDAAISQLRRAFQPRSGGALELSLPCPTGDHSALTGGGWQDFATPPINEGLWERAWPTTMPGHSTWHAGLAGNRTTPSFAYAICAPGRAADGMVTRHVTTPPVGAATCPARQRLVGGGSL
jgi:hypothetical protein